MSSVHENKASLPESVAVTETRGMRESFSGAQPRYRHLADRLRQRILKGDYEVGALLPTEMEIGAQYAVSRATVREAMRTLQGEGLVSRRAGIGTRIESLSPAPRYQQAGTSLTELLAERIRLHLASSKTVVADEATAALLRCAAGQLYLRLDGIVRRAGEGAASPALYWAEIFVADTYADILDDAAAHEGTIANLVERKSGQTVTRIEQEIDPTLVEPGIGRRLAAKAGAPALLIKRWYYIADRYPAVVAITTRPGDRFTYVSKLVRQHGP